MTKGLILPHATPDPADVDFVEVQRRDQELREAFRERKRAHVSAFEVLLVEIKAADALADQPAYRTTIKSHPQDFALLDKPGFDINVLVVTPEYGKLTNGTLADLVLYRTFDHTIAFGLWNGLHVPEGMPSVCFTMRASRFVEVMLPDEAYGAHDVDAAHATLDLIHEALKTLLVTRS